MEVYGREGTLTVAGPDSPQLNDVVIMGAQGNNKLERLSVPDRFTITSAGHPKEEAFNVGQMYARFNRAIRGEAESHPTFDTAVGLHHLIDAIRKASDSKSAVTFS
jgi:predicted dehydrogenase